MSPASSIAISESGKVDTYDFARLIEGSLLVQVQDRGLVPDSICVAMSQFEPYRMTALDRIGQYRRHVVGSAGLCCKHCGGQPGSGSGRCFTNSYLSLTARTRESILRHVSSTCPSCPVAIRKTVTDLERLEDIRKSKEKRRRKPDGSKKVFYQRVWARLHASSDDNCATVQPKSRERHAPAVATAAGIRTTTAFTCIEDGPSCGGKCTVKKAQPQSQVRTCLSALAQGDKSLVSRPMEEGSQSLMGSSSQLAYLKPPQSYGKTLEETRAKPQHAHDDVTTHGTTLKQQRQRRRLKTTTDTAEPQYSLTFRKRVLKETIRALLGSKSSKRVRTTRMPRDHNNNAVAIDRRQGLVVDSALHTHTMPTTLESPQAVESESTFPALEDDDNDVIEVDSRAADEAIAVDNHGGSIVLVSSTIAPVSETAPCEEQDPDDFDSPRGGDEEDEDYMEEEDLDKDVEDSCEFDSESERDPSTSPSEVESSSEDDDVEHDAGSTTDDDCMDYDHGSEGAAPPAKAASKSRRKRRRCTQKTPISYKCESSDDEDDDDNLLPYTYTPRTSVKKEESSSVDECVTTDSA